MLVGSVSLFYFRATNIEPHMVSWQGVGSGSGEVPVIDGLVGFSCAAEVSWSELRFRNYEIMERLGMIWPPEPRAGSGS